MPKRSKRLSKGTKVARARELRLTRCRQKESGAGVGWWSLLFFQAEDGIRDIGVTGVQTCALPIFGIGKAGDAGELKRALDEAAALDRRLIVEAGVDAREIEVSVLGNEEAEVSVPGEILVKKGEFYDYEAKYAEGGMELVAPADIPDETMAELRRIARTAYEAIDAAGMARVDFFLEREAGRLLINEINTIPGFTPTSVYSRLWAASGLPYEELLDRLIRLALERHG